MKRKRKTRKTFTLTQKRGLVNNVITLLNQGVKLTHARIEIARKNGTTPISLARWAKDITVTDIPKSNGKMLLTKDLQPVFTNSRESKVYVTSVDLHVPGIQGTIKLDHKVLNHISKLAGYTG